MPDALYPASRHDRPHARIYDHEMKHPAWRGLSGNALKLLVALLASYRPNKPNSFPVGAATVARLTSVSDKTAKRLVDELITTGHLREERKGRNRGVVKTRERVVSLTRHDTDTQKGDPALPIKRWQDSRTPQKFPNEPRKKSGSQNSANLRKPNIDGHNVVPLKTPSTRI
jgi:hypothetical protein